MYQNEILQETCDCPVLLEDHQLFLVTFKVQMKCFFIAEFERAAKIRKIAVYRFLISLLVPEL